MPDRHIFIACPSGTGRPDHTTELTIRRAMMECAERGWKCDTMYRNHDSMITRARDVLFSQFYALDYLTDLFFIDDDIGARPGSFARLMEHPVDFVGGAYRGRRDTEEYTIRAINESLQFDPDNKLMEVEAVATGFLRITRKVAETLVNADPEGWYYDSTAPKGMKVYSLFDNFLDRERREKWSEDYYFCRRWRELGGRVWVDPLLQLDHTGTKTWTGCLFDHLQKQLPAQVPQAVQPPSTVLDAARALVAAAA